MPVEQKVLPNAGRWSVGDVQRKADEEVYSVQYFARGMAWIFTRISRVSVAGEAVEQRSISLV